MTPNASRWQSDDRYDHLQNLTASGFAWEWLRRNEVYHRDFKAFRAGSDKPGRGETIRRRWRLRFPRRSDP
jgi:hypothetical protein